MLEDAQISNLADHRRVIQWLNHQVRRAGSTFARPQHTTEKEFRQGLAYLLEFGTSEAALEELFKDHPKFGVGLLKSKKKAVEVVRDQLTKLVTIERDRDKVKDHGARGSDVSSLPVRVALPASRPREYRRGDAAQTVAVPAVCSAKMR